MTDALRSFTPPPPPIPESSLGGAPRPRAAGGGVRGDAGGAG